MPKLSTRHFGDMKTVLNLLMRGLTSLKTVRLYSPYSLTAEYSRLQTR